MARYPHDEQISAGYFAKLFTDGGSAFRFSWCSLQRMTESYSVETVLPFFVVLSDPLDIAHISIKKIQI